MLVVAAGLTVRSFAALNVDLGFEPAQLLTMEYRLPGNKYQSGEAQAAFHRDVLDRVRAVPGVVEAAGVRALPFSGNGSTTGFWISQRTREIGVRVALGATPGGLLRMVLWQGARLGAIGIGAGLALARLTARGVQGFLYAVDAHDPITYASAGAALMIAASALPARRATRVDVAICLRE